MMRVPTPEDTQMALIGEWQFINTLTAPPASGQLRLNQTIQKNATLMWVHKTSATGLNATAQLAEVKEFDELRIQDKDEPDKWHVYAVNGTPVSATSHMQFPVAWVRGGLDVPQQRLTFEVLPPVNQIVVLEPLPGLAAHTAHVEVKGQLVTFDYAFPFLGPNVTSPGMTIRQFYAGQALMGFIASQAPAANLIGKVAPYCFTVADSLLEFERKESEGIKVPIAGTPRRVA